MGPPDRYHGTKIQHEFTSRGPPIGLAAQVSVCACGKFHQSACSGDLRVMPSTAGVVPPGSRERAPDAAVPDALTAMLAVSKIIVSGGASPLRFGEGPSEARTEFV
jgi:hypothetical protein